MTIKTKFNLNSIVWLIHGSIIRSAKVMSIEIHLTPWEPKLTIKYRIELLKIVKGQPERTIHETKLLGDPIPENLLFSSSRALISSLRS